ncbi:MAG: hypothetical protein RIQ81_2113 [Pseudomonadota bacterium]
MGRRMPENFPGPIDFGLAPMEGVTDWPARIWFAQASSPAFLWTPFLRVTDSFPARELPPVWCPELFEPIGGTGRSARVIPQLMATNPSDFIRVSELILRKVDKAFVNSGFFIDLNCGCPSPVVVGGRAGSSLLEDPAGLRGFLEFALQHVGADKLSVKVRTGFHDPAEFPRIIEALKGLPLAQVSVHGRTRPQRYLGRADLGLIDLAARNLDPVKVVGSGDICDLASADSAAATAPGVRTWIIGRGALRNPWIFEELRTGNPVSIELGTLTHAIQVFALLHELHWNAPADLVALWRDGVFHAMPPAGTDSVRWQGLLELIQSRLPGGRVNPGRRACARTKMLWNYLRSSLPVALRDGVLLRSGNVDELVGGICALWRAHLGDSCVLVHDPEWNWVYNGSGKPDTREASHGVRTPQGKNTGP